MRKPPPMTSPLVLYRPAHLLKPMMKTHIVTASIVIVALGLALAGCSKSSSPGGSGAGGTSLAAPGATQIAFVTNGTSDYWAIARGGVNDAANELGPSYNVQFTMPADGTAATQKQEVNDLITKGVKAIAISPIDPANETTWLNSIADQAALITQDSDAPASKRLCYLGTDNHAAGLLAGKLIMKYLPQGGKIMIFVGSLDVQNAKDRIQGIRDAIKGSNVQIVDIRTDNADHALAKSNAADALVANPDLAMEVGIWSYDGPAIASAIGDAHKAGKVKIVCFDQEEGTLAAIRSGGVSATVVQDPYTFGYKCTKLLANLVKGDKSGIPASGVIFIPVQAVDASNIATYTAALDKQTGKTW